MILSCKGIEREERRRKSIENLLDGEILKIFGRLDREKKEENGIKIRRMVRVPPRVATFEGREGGGGRYSILVESGQNYSIFREI